MSNQGFDPNAPFTYNCTLRADEFVSRFELTREIKNVEDALVRYYSTLLGDVFRYWLPNDRTRYAKNVQLPLCEQKPVRAIFDAFVERYDKLMSLLCTKRDPYFKYECGNYLANIYNVDKDKYQDPMSNIITKFAELKDEIAKTWLSFID
jgi:hypothetical protein